MTWDAVHFSFPGRYRELVDLWQTRWVLLGLEPPSSISISEERPGWLRFSVERHGVAAYHMYRLEALQWTFFPETALEALSVSLDDALRSRSGEVPTPLLGERTA